VTDQIFIKNLSLDAIVGINEHERHHRQKIIINVVMSADLSAACRSDSIDDTVDYFVICEHIKTLVDNSQFFLVESLAEAIADICLSDKLVTSAQVTIEKPEALRHAESAGVVVERKR